MSRLRVHCFSISLDGYGAGPRQCLEDPLGEGGMALHEWAFATRNFRAMHGESGGETGIDDDFIARGFAGIGAWVIGRNMFGPVRGKWPEEPWNGWWGDEPPYHCQVFVLTHFPRPPLEMKGGTAFHFVTTGLETALHRAREAAGGGDVRIGGGVRVVRDCLRAGQVDEMHLAVAPVLLGSGESLLHDLDLPALGYGVAEQVVSPRAAHYVLRR